MSLSTFPKVAPVPTRTYSPVVTVAPTRKTNSAVASELKNVASFFGFTLNRNFSIKGLVILTTLAIIAIAITNLAINQATDPAVDFSIAQLFGYFPAEAQYGVDYVRN